MSGGHYQLRGYQVTELGTDILQDASKYSTSGESGDYYSKEKWGPLAPEVLAVLRQVGHATQRIGELLHTVDKLMSGDHGEESFLRLYQEWLAEGGISIGEPAVVSPSELAALRSHSLMLSQIAGHVMPYLSDDEEATTLEGVKAMQKEIDRLKAELAAEKKDSNAKVKDPAKAGQTTNK